MVVCPDRTSKDSGWDMNRAKSNEKKKVTTIRPSGQRPSVGEILGWQSYRYELVCLIDGWGRPWVYGDALRTTEGLRQTLQGLRASHPGQNYQQVTAEAAWVPLSEIRSMQVSGGNWSQKWIYGLSLNSWPLTLQVNGMRAEEKMEIFACCSMGEDGPNYRTPLGTAKPTGGVG